MPAFTCDACRRKYAGNGIIPPRNNRNYRIVCPSCFRQNFGTHTPAPASSPSFLQMLFGMFTPHVNVVPNASHLLSPGGSNLLSPGGSNLLSPGGSNIVAQGGLNNHNNIVAQGGLNLLSPGGSNIVAQGGLNNHNNIVAQGGLNIVAQGGLNFRRNS